MDNNNLGEVLKERRKERNLTFTALHDLSGVSSSHLGRIERGERIPSAAIVGKMAKPLGFTETELLKLAGLLSRDDSDDRVDRLKEEIKRELAEILASLHKKIDSL